MRSVPRRFAVVAVTAFAAAIIPALPASASVSAGNFSYNASPGSTLSVAAPGLLAGAVDTDGGTPSAESNSFPNHGTVTVNSDGSFTFSADQGYVGGDSFTYQVCDSASFNCATGSVSLTISAPSPTATNQSYTVRPGATISIAAPGLLGGSTAPNNDSLTASIVSYPNDGLLTPNQDGAFDFTANGGFVGNDSFTYKLCDSVTGLCSSVATVSIAITAPVPAAVAHAYTVRPSGQLSVAAPGLLAGASVPSGDNLTASIVTDPTEGTLTPNDDGAFVYAPDSFGPYVGRDSFTYDVCDTTTQLCSGATTVSIVVGIAPRLAVPGVVRVVAGTPVARRFRMVGVPLPNWRYLGRLPLGLRLVRHGKLFVELVGKPVLGGKARIARARIRLVLTASLFPRWLRTMTIVVVK